MRKRFWNGLPTIRFYPSFYEDQNRYAFPLEMSFLADRYQQIADDLAQFDLFRGFYYCGLPHIQIIDFGKSL